MEVNSRLQSLQSRYFPLNHECFTDMGVLSWIEAHPLPPHIDEGLLRYWKSSERSQAIIVPDSSVLPGHLPRTFWYLQSAKKSELGKGTWHTRSANQPRNAKSKDSKASNIPCLFRGLPNLEVIRFDMRIRPQTQMIVTFSMPMAALQRLFQWQTFLPSLQQPQGRGC